MNPQISLIQVSQDIQNFKMFADNSEVGFVKVNQDDKPLNAGVYFYKLGDDPEEKNILLGIIENRYPLIWTVRMNIREYHSDGSWKDIVDREHEKRVSFSLRNFSDAVIYIVNKRLELLPPVTDNVT